MKGRHKAIVFIVIGAVGAVVLVWAWISYRRARSVQWGRGSLRVSERAYYLCKKDEIVEKWRDLTRELGYELQKDTARRFVQPYHLYLAVDADKKMIWIENNGAVLSSYCLRLPRRMTWDVFHSDSPDSSAKLARLVRLQLRGANGARWQRERINLVGRDETGRELRIAVHQTRWPEDSREGNDGQKKMQPGQESDLEYYESVVVSDAEYKANQRLLADTAGADQWTGVEEPSVLKDNRAAWLKVEKALYQAIEKRVLEAGLELERVEVACGSEFTAGHAIWGANRSSFIRYYVRRVLSRSTRRVSYIRGYFKIDRVGDGLWYVKSASHERYTRGGEPMLEFLVSTAGRISRRQRQGWLKEARNKAELTSVPVSPWRASLPNGATVEFVGLCENPSVGRQWWGPDGSALGYAPHYTTGVAPAGESYEKAYELVWRVHWPEAPDAKRYDCEGLVEGPTRYYTRGVFDRYGERLRRSPAGTRTRRSATTLHSPEGGWYANGCIFMDDCRNTTLRLGVQVGEQGYQWVSFKNISLLPGEDYGFRIEVEE